MNPTEHDHEAKNDAGADDGSTTSGLDDLNTALGDADAVFVTGEKKPSNAGSLALLGLVVLGIAGVYFMYRRSGPANASADIVREQVAAKTTIRSFLDSSGANIKSMEQMLRNTEKVVQQFLTYPSMTQVPLRDLRTNPFRAKASTPTTVALSEAAEKRKREEERLGVLKAVQQLQLQSIMYSDARAACIINNTMQREGQTVEGFTIEKISPTTVIVKNAAYRFELKTQK